MLSKVSKYYEGITSKIEKGLLKKSADKPGIEKLDLGKIKGDINVSSKLQTNFQHC